MRNKINKIQWGKIFIKDQQYHDILIYNNNIEERDYPKLKKLFGTSHKIGNWETEKLFQGNPEVIIIGKGFFGAVEISDRFKAKTKEIKIELLILTSKRAVKKYNKLVKEGKKVNALIHSTC